MNNKIILTEAANKSRKSERKYKCMYCDERYTREKLVNHIEKNHSDMISEEYTAARQVFNMINKKDHGTCAIDGKETKWREDLWRYERFCCDKCHAEAGRRAKANMIKVYGKETLLNDPEHQEKMLKGRSISGTYKFTHGGSLEYVGSYEKKFLEFCDKVMGFKASDFGHPPVIEYIYNGEKHFWITDFYLEPFNLVFDIKDGGDNPNTRDMKSYREKQICKEKSIEAMGQYNYIRLTNNNFAQLLLVLAELKAQMMGISEDNNPIIRTFECTINESFKSLDELASAVMGAMVDNRKAYIIPYIQKGSFEQSIGISHDPKLSTILTMDNMGQIIPKDYNFMEEECTYYKVFVYEGDLFKVNKEPSNLYEFVTGRELLSPDQLEYDSSLQEIISPKEECNIHESCTIGEMNKLIDNSDVINGKFPNYKVPVIHEEYIQEEDIMFYNNDRGYFVENIITGKRSREYKSLNSIPKNVINYIMR